MSEDLDRKLYQKTALTLGSTDIVYASRADGSADGKAPITAITAIVQGDLDLTYAPYVHTHYSTDILDFDSAVDARISAAGGYTDEDARDAIGTALTAGTGISVTVNDGANTITLASTITQYTDEMARDALGVALTAGTGITITPNDGADTITIAATGGGGTVTTSGSPASGNLAKFSGSTAITSGDLSGDVTTSGTLATTIGNAKVTLAKIANAGANSRLLGAGSAGSGASYTELTLGTGLTMGASSLAVDVASSSDVTTGSSATKPMPPDALRGSDYGKRFVQLLAGSDYTSALTTGDGKDYWSAPSEFNGWNLVGVFGVVLTVSTSGLPTFQVARVRAGTPADTLTTKLTIDANERDSSTAATAAVINTSNDDVATGDVFRLDCDVAGTGTAGAIVTLIFQKP